MPTKKTSAGKKLQMADDDTSAGTSADESTNESMTASTYTPSDAGESYHTISQSVGGGAGGGNADTTANNIDEASIASSTSATSAESLWLRGKTSIERQRMDILPNETALLTNWMQKIRIYQKAAYEANIYYKHLDTFLGIMPVILNAAIVLLKGYQFVFVGERIITIVNFATLVVATILQSVHSFLKLSKQSESMRHTSDELAKLHLQIQVYLSRKNHTLTPPVEFIDLVRKDISSMIDKAANIPIRIMSKYQMELLELDASVITRFDVD